MSEKCDVCGRDDGWHDLRTHAWQGQTQAPLLRSMLDDPSTWNVEPEAHMMSAPAGYCPMCAGTGAHMDGCPNDPITMRPQGVQGDTVTITRAEYDALRAEVERLRTINASLATQVSSAEIEVATVYERLRKVKDDEQKCDRSHMVGEARPDFPKHPQAPSLAMVADTLDPRLGTPQPDGEPCEPMSARRWRWLP